MKSENGAKKIVLFGMGGTIAMRPKEADGTGAVPAASIDDLAAAIPQLEDCQVDLRMVDLRRKPSASLTFGDMIDLATAVDDAVAEGVAGCVVLQGTDTLEETSYLLDLWYGRSAPVVVTGAMRHASQPGADGPANLLAAVQVAASPTAADQGVLVVFADEIHAARSVCKRHTTHLSAFESPNEGPLGYVVEGRPRWMHRYAQRTPIPQPRVDNIPRVMVLTPGLSEAGEIVKALPNLDGLVIAGSGVGHVPESFAEPLGEMTTKYPVVLTSRTGSGCGLADTYGYAGSERDLLGRGLIRAGFLQPLKARILLTALLAAGCDDKTMRQAFAAAGGYADGEVWPFTGA